MDTNNALRYFRLLLVILPLSACSWTINFSNQFSVIPIGSVLTLNQKLHIPPGKTGIYIQAGQVMERPSVNEYLPNCRFEVSSLNNSTFTVVDEDKFEVYKVMFDSELVSSERIMYAALELISYGASLMADIRTTEFFLKSVKQPDVLRLRCGHWEDPSDAFYLNLDQVTQALGDVITIDLAQVERK